MIDYKHLDSLCRREIEDYDARVGLAWHKMDRMRCPFRMADAELYSEMEGVLEDHEYDLNDIDIEEIISV